MLGLRFRPK